MNNRLKTVENVEGGPTKYRVCQITFEKFVKKKLLNIFSNFLFHLKVQSFRLIIENNFIQMAASAAIIVCVQLYFTNGFSNIVL